MVKENNLQTLMKQFWQSLVEANEHLNEFINSGMPSTTEKRLKSFVRKWDLMKDKADALCAEIETATEASIDPVEISLPWGNEQFETAWLEWKDYLAEQHHRYMKSRMERAALMHLKNLCDGNVELAIEFLHFAMANGYPRFFKVTNKYYEQPNIVGGRGDGDF